MPKTILIVGGTFSDKSNPDGTYGKPSGLLKKINNAILQNNTQENTDITAITNQYNNITLLHSISPTTKKYMK